MLLLLFSPLIPDFAQLISQIELDDFLKAFSVLGGVLTQLLLQLGELDVRHQPFHLSVAVQSLSEDGPGGLPFDCIISLQHAVLWQHTHFEDLFF